MYQDINHSIIYENKKLETMSMLSDRKCQNKLLYVHIIRY